MSVSISSLGLDRLDLADRISLVEELWDSIAAESEAFALTEVHLKDLQQRIETELDDPNAGSSWEEVRERLKGTSA